jgi:hypothetical protein
LADDGLETVRPDQKVTLDNRAIGKAQLNAVAALVESNNPAVQSNGVTLEFAHLRREQSVNIRAVNLVIRRPVQFLMLIEQRKSVNLFTAVMKPEDVGPGSNARLGQRRSEPEMVEHMSRIGAQLKTGSDLAQLGCLLEDRDIVPCL